VCSEEKDQCELKDKKTYLRHDDMMSINASANICLFPITIGPIGHGFEYRTVAAWRRDRPANNVTVRIQLDAIG
jgi:hypothetical protein